MSQSPDPSHREVPLGHSGTVLESEEVIRQAALADWNWARGNAPTSPREVTRDSPQVPISSSKAYRPTARPPVPILTVFDDGKADGEAIRIRSPRFTIGRAEGDLRFPIDGRMSASHVEITHQVVEGRHRWVVTDLQSTHGLFVRVSKTVLTDRAEILVGAGRYRFDANRPDMAATTDRVLDDSDTGSTRGLDDDSGAPRPPSLSELVGKEIGNRILLVKGEYWIGSDPSCAFCRADDPFCEPRHVRVHRSPQGAWSAEHHKTRNGLWLRMAQVATDSVVHFQVGEQRFRLKV